MNKVVCGIRLRVYVCADDVNHVHMLIVMFGVALRHIGATSGLSFKPANGTFEGNAQCVATAAATLSSVLVALSSNPQTLKQSIIQAQKHIVKVSARVCVSCVVCRVSSLRHSICLSTCLSPALPFPLLVICRLAVFCCFVWGCRRSTTRTATRPCLS